MMKWSERNGMTSCVFVRAYKNMYEVRSIMFCWCDEINWKSKEELPVWMSMRTLCRDTISGSEWIQLFSFFPIPNKL